MINILWVDPALFKWTGSYLHPHMLPHSQGLLLLSASTYGQKELTEAFDRFGGKISNLFALDYTIKASKNWLYYKMTQQILNEFELITFIFFQACERAESSKSCNLIRSESGWYFMILPTNPARIIDCFIHKFVCCLWMSKNHPFQTIFLLTLVLLLASAKERWILLFGQKIWSVLSKPARKTAKVKQNRRLVMSLFTSFITAL